jgi:hypothetical protein
MKSHLIKREYLHMELEEEQILRRRVPTAIAYLSPFRIISSSSTDTWSASIDQINTGSWDYVGLHEMIGGIDVGLPDPYHMVISRDGALALPVIPPLKSDQAIIAFFNECLAAFLLGGIYWEAIPSDGLDFGCIIDWKYLRANGLGHAASNQFHLHVRHRSASPIEAIHLLQPRTLALDDMLMASKLGRRVLDGVQQLRGEYLLQGVTGLARRNWGVALANLWIVVEQIASHLWEREIIASTQVTDPSSSRRDQLLDTRTWTISARIEVLFQKGVIGGELVDQLTRARKARNALAHSGTHPGEADATYAYHGVCGLLKTALNEESIPLFDLNLSDHSLSDPFAPPTADLQPTYWMEIPKLPGEEELERAEASIRSRFSSSEDA